jgi:MFS family permease
VQEGPLREADRLAPAPPAPESGARRLAKLAAIDLGPLRRHREYRLLWIGLAVSFFGSEMTYVAIPYQAYRLTGSTAVVGLLALVELAPLLAAAVVGGAFADAVDRKRMVRFTELGLALLAALLLANSLLPHPQLWILFVDAACGAGLTGFLRPSLDALTPRLVDRDELTAAGALDSLRFQVGTIGGPVVAGSLIAAAGLPLVFGLDIGTFLVSLTALTLMRAVPPPEGAERPSLKAIAEGFRYARGRPELLGTYGVDMVAMFFGMPQALFPALANRFGGASVLGLLYAAGPAGSLGATLTSGWTARIRRHGLGVIAAAAAWGVGITLLGLAPSLPLALAALAFAGAADMVSGIFRSTIWNQTIPDRLRGRLAGIEQVSYSSGPLLGDLEAGVVGSLAGVRASIVSGGVLCVAGVAATALLLPAFRRYDARTFAVAHEAEPVAAERPAEELPEIASS